LSLLGMSEGSSSSWSSVGEVVRVCEQCCEWAVLCLRSIWEVSWCSGIDCYGMIFRRIGEMF
jgi:hypothetical protein